ncbi:hypothetical protein KL936_000417 [Ogataea polymorpha]|nr:hypothetical protein KL936_000417 [Ogataea polymorpha]
MGRRKIEIQPINDERNRTVTFVKRKAGLFKKAHELSILCKVDIAVIIIGHNHKVYEYSSNNPQAVIEKYQQSGQTQESKRPQDYGNYKLVSRVSTKKGARNDNRHVKQESVDENISDDQNHSELDGEEEEDAEYDETPTKKRKLSRSVSSEDRSRRPTFAPPKETGVMPPNSKLSKRPLLSLQIPSNDRSTSDSDITVTALESGQLNAAKEGGDAGAAPGRTSQNAKKVSIVATPTSNSFLPGLNIMTQQNTQNPLDQTTSSNKSTPVSATLPHGLFSSLPQMSPTQILPTPVFPLGPQQQQQLVQQQNFAPYSAKFQPKSSTGPPPFFNYTGDTPVLPSGLSSRFLDMFPSPNVYYSQDWPMTMGAGNPPVQNPGGPSGPGSNGQPNNHVPQQLNQQQGGTNNGDSGQKGGPAASSGSTFGGPTSSSGTQNPDGNFSTMTSPLQVIGSAIYNQAAQAAERREEDK